VKLFEQVATVQQQWAYTFDSIGDPIFVHDPEFRILRINQRLGNLLGRDSAALIGRTVTDLLLIKGSSTSVALIAKASPGRETIQILGSRDISWPPIRHSPIRTGDNWEPFTP